MGRPKAEIDVHGKAILKFLLDRWQWPGPTMLVTAPGREHPPGWQLFGREVGDPVAGSGPLRGIVTALESAGSPLVVLATCDMPLIAREQLEWVVARLREDSHKLGVMTRRGGGEVEPFPTALRSSALEVLAQRLEEGFRSLRPLATLDGFEAIDVPREWPQEVWTNLNEPRDLQRFLEMVDG
jgi:molybdopterin-guanine dinucleotide biosynthesis protein A